MLEKKEERVGLRIRRLDHKLSRNLRAHVKMADIDEVTVMHGWIIRYLYENRGRDIFQKDIERFFSIGRSTVTNIIQLMEKKEFIRRESVDYDARLKKVVLTERGASSHEAMEALVERMDMRLLNGIKETQLETFFQVIDQMEENLKKEKIQLRKEELDDTDLIERSKRV